MSNKKFEEFYNLYMSVEIDEELMLLPKDFTLGCSLDELIAWNQ